MTKGTPDRDDDGAMSGVEHRPWIGERYGEQPKGARLLIAGFSHNGHNEGGTDDDGFTERVVADLGVGGGQAFFNSIAGYFGEEPAIFWQRVAFFNTLPSTVGDHRYAAGTQAQRDAVEPRVKRIIGEVRPDRIFVFTRKGWRMWPGYTGQLTDGTLRVPGVDEIDCGTYAHADGEAVAFGLRHPQFARAADMTAIVSAALAFTP